MKQWEEGMGEISGFGGGYEAVCRAMVIAGINWLDAHPDADPHFHGFKNVYGIAIEDNEDAKALTDAMMGAPVYLDGKLIQETVRQDCTGAMHHAATNHCMAYKRLGWDEYKRELEERARDDR